ncbi:MAG: hypothetical protein FWG70_00160 [Oscillospiraceae bacterium]|nr:hypothetical protein [Oscillospiraceae bacterium]
MKTRITAIITAVTMLFGVIGLSACADTRNALTADGEQIRAGEYIYEQIRAAQEGADMFNRDNPEVDVYDENFDYFKHASIDGKAFGDWVNDRTVEILRERRVAEIMFGELGLSLTMDDEIFIRNSVESFRGSNEDLNRYSLDYGTWGEFYEDIGVGRESLTAIFTNDLMLERVFEAIYGENGTQEVSREEIDALLTADYARFRMIEGMDGELSEEQLQELESTLEGYAARLNEGESFTAIYNSYSSYVNMRDEGFEEDTDDYGSDAGDGVPTEEPTDPEAEPESDEPDFDGWEAADDNLHDLAEKRDSFYYIPPDVTAFLFDMEINTAAIFRSEDFEATYLLQRLDVLEREDWFNEDVIKSLLLELKGDEMREKISVRADSVAITLNDAAIKRYKPETAAKRGLLQPMW